MAEVKEKATNAADFSIVGVVPGIVYYQGREIDLSKLTKEEGLKLADDPKMPYVIRKVDEKVG
jgi:hypothetical protein